MSAIKGSTDNIRTALNVGTTLTTRFWLGLMGCLQGLAFLMQSPSWLSHASFVALNSWLPLQAWGFAFVGAGLLGMWRVLSPASRPRFAWCINAAVALVWAAAVVVRAWYAGPTTLCSLYTVGLLMALWVNTRTQATHRDEATA